MTEEINKMLDNASTELAKRMREQIGGNNPPSLIEFSAETATALSDWLKEYPIIETEEQVRDGKVLYDRASDCLRDMETERKARGKPLQEQIDLINGEYRSPRTILEKIRQELSGRLNEWRRKEQERRDKAIEEARRQKGELEREAREAEVREQGAKEEAAAGVEVDLAAVTRAADDKFRTYANMERKTARLEAARDVKIRGGYRPALGESRFQKKRRIVVDPNRALAVMGWSERLLEALKSDALQYRSDHGHLPDGIIEEIK